MAQYTSKPGIVSRPPYELYMGFADMRSLVERLPEDKRTGVTADFDSIHGNFKGFDLGVKVSERRPYSRIELVDDGAPFHFTVSLHFDATPAGDAGKTDFWIEVDPDLNFFMRQMIGSKISDALDKIVAGLVAVSEGRMPEGVDPSMFK